MQAATAGPLQEVEKSWPAQNIPTSLPGQPPPVQARVAATAGVAPERTRNAGTAIASPLMARFMNVRRVFAEPKRLRDPGSPEADPG
jgi:hypothetical protein